MKKRITALLLSVVLCLGMLSTAALAAGTPTATGTEGEYTIAVTGGDANKLCALWGDSMFEKLLLLFYTDSSGNATVTVDKALTMSDTYYVGIEGQTSSAVPVTINKGTTPPPVVTTPVESVTLDKSTLSLKVGESTTLTATVVPDNATDKTVTWACSDTSVATVDENGKVTAVSEGTATITAAAGGKSASCTVTVTKESGGGGGGGSYGGGGGSSVSSGYTVSVPASVPNGKVSVSPKSAAEGKTVTITATPDEGYEVGTVTVTDKDGNQIEVTDAGDGKYTFTMPKGKVEVNVEFVEKQGQTEPVPVRFTDVDSGAWYAGAVNWAVSEGITAGTSATTFSPDAPCTRAQVVTFLWRAAGSPKATGSNPFTDISAGAYYYDAVLWAVEKGITVGTSAATFSPDTVCTRAQIVTFLWRAAGSPAASGSNPFTDVSQGSYYYDAVLWAVSQGITAGTSATTFSPDTACTRAQAVTFLYRAAGSPAANGSDPFTDVFSGAYYAGAVQWAVGRSITHGTSTTTFSPDAGCTRAQIVTFLYRDRTGKT